MASSIRKAEVVATNATLGGESAYKVDFTPINALPKGAIIVVVLPETLRLANPNAPMVVCNGLINLKGPLNCVYDSSLH